MIRARAQMLPHSEELPELAFGSIFKHTYTQNTLQLFQPCIPSSVLNLFAFVPRVSDSIPLSPNLPKCWPRKPLYSSLL